MNNLQSPAPGPYVKEMNDAGQFYTNRVLKDSKDSRASKDWTAPANSHVDWTKSWVSTLINLQALVKQFHTTGLVWNPKGGDAKAQTGKWNILCPCSKGCMKFNFCLSLILKCVNQI